jgi:YidC/Oxa1 family membrane protein insertase
MWDTLIITPFLNVLLFIYTVVGQNFGLSIILFTFLIRLVTFPLTQQQIKGAASMQDLQKNKKWQDMQKKHKGDKEKLAQAQMELYKELGINPLASCLPTVIQFPIIIGLYQSVIRSLASTPTQLLDLAQHVYPNLLNFSELIPLNSKFLWMNLAQPERLNLPFLDFGIPILAVVVVATTYLQSKLMSPTSAGSGDQGAQMSKMMNIYMPFLMGYLALTLASGLSLYFVASNVIGIAQYAAMGRLNWNNILPSRTPAKSK